MNTKLPKLEPGKCAVVFAERATGILLTPQGSRYLGEGEFCQVFDSESEAEVFAIAYVQLNPDIGCSIRDSDGRHLKFVG